MVAGAIRGAGVVRIRSRAGSGGAVRGGVLKQMQRRSCLAEPLESRRLLSTDLVADVTGVFPANAVTVDGIAYFGANDGAHGGELWRSDGTPAGTLMVKDAFPGSRGASISDITPFKGKLIYLATDRNHDVSLWISDGTAAGTIALKYFGVANTTEVSAAPCAVLGQRFVFFVHPETANRPVELWSTDGTASGTVLASHVADDMGMTFNDLTLHVASGHAMYYKDGNLWTTDGSKGGTFELSDQLGLQSGTAGASMLVLNDRLLFWQSQNGHAQFWSTDGTSAGSAMVSTSIESGSIWKFGNIAIIESVNLSTDRYDLWRTDGTAAGTRMITTMPGDAINANTFGPLYLAGRLYFVTKGQYTGLGLWTSDGTVEGTYSVKDITQNASAATQFIEAGGYGFFLVMQRNLYGRWILRELWRTDGTEAGTAAAMDLTSYAENQNGQSIDEHAAAGEQIPQQDYQLDYDALKISEAYGQIVVATAEHGTLLLDPDTLVGPTGPAQGYSRLTSGVLRVFGTRNDDNIHLTRSLADSSRLIVDMNGVKTSYALDQISRIYIYGSSGDDAIAYNDLRGVVAVKQSRIWSGAGDDTVCGSSGIDSIYAGGGNDVIRSGNGDDVVEGGGGNDSITAGTGDDTVSGQGGADTILTGSGDDVLCGGPGDARDRLDGGAGADVIFGRSVYEIFYSGKRRQDPSGLDEVLYS